MKTTTSTSNVDISIQKGNYETLAPSQATMSEWIDIINDVMEAITFSIRLKKGVFVKLWTKCVKYVKPLKLIQHLTDVQNK